MKFNNFQEIILTKRICEQNAKKDKVNPKTTTDYIN